VLKHVTLACFAALLMLSSGDRAEAIVICVSGVNINCGPIGGCSWNVEDSCPGKKWCIPDAGAFFGVICDYLSSYGGACGPTLALAQTNKLICCVDTCTQCGSDACDACD
jgi:hypothetical protein